MKQNNQKTSVTAAKSSQHLEDGLGPGRGGGGSGSVDSGGPLEWMAISLLQQPGFDSSPGLVADCHFLLSLLSFLFGQLFRNTEKKVMKNSNNVTQNSTPTRELSLNCSKDYDSKKASYLYFYFC